MTGLIVSRVPLEVENALGGEYVGLMSAPFYVLPLLLSRRTSALLDTQGRFRMAALGFAFSLLSLAVFHYASDGWTLSAAILAATLGAVILNPLITVLPGDMAERGTPLIRVSASVSIAGFFGIFFGILAARTIRDSRAYIMVGTSMLACCIPFLWILRSGKDLLRRRVAQFPTSPVPLPGP
jgi:hypothetical protein